MRPWHPVSLLLVLGVGLTPLLGEATSSDAAATRERQWAPCGTTAERLGDLHPGPPGSEPQELVHGDGVLFFTADDGSTGRELWRSSGTGGPGTFRVKDIRLGAEGSEPTGLTVVGGLLFFSADDGVHGRELWVSDGTAAGTHMVKDIRAGLASALPTPFPFPSSDPLPRMMVEYKGVLYFSADDGVHGRELWRSDGTAAGTYLLEELNPGPDGSSPRRFIRGGDDAFYFVANEDFDVHLWRSTGTPGATSVFEAPEDNFLFRFTVVKTRLFFLVDNDEGEASLFKTDGTDASTRHLRFFHGEYPHDFVALGSRLVFSAGREDVDSGIPGEPEGEELWVSDGTVSGTKRVKDIRSGPGDSSPGALAVLNQRVFFAADDGSGVGRELWVSDGTEAGTVLFKELEPGAGSSSPEALTSIKGTLFFSADTSGRGREPWRSDGTFAGTVPLDELAPGAASSSPRGFLRSGWDIFFTADDGATGREPWALPFRPDDACDARHR
jgi:ELWxxDGT repeat protein